MSTQRFFIYTGLYGKIITSYKTKDEIPLSQLNNARLESSFIVLYHEHDTLRTVYLDTKEEIQQALEAAKKLRLEFPNNHTIRVECTPNLSYWGHEIV